MTGIRGGDSCLQSMVEYELTEASGEDNTQVVVDTEAEIMTEEIKEEKKVSVGDLSIKAAKPKKVEETTVETTTSEPPSITASLKENEDVYVNKEEGDIDSSNTIAGANKIFLDSVKLIVDDFPINKADFILADISTPIIAVYGDIDNIYKMAGYEKKDDEARFDIIARDGVVFKVSVTKVGSEYKVEVKKWG